VGERAQRIGRNEAVFRIVNERLEDLSETFGPAAGPMQLVCECGSAACTESISVSASEYEAVRADAELFVVAHGHVADDVERVVEERPAYDVVRKDPGAPATIARATDPRDAA
jgi:hypothetical protein